MEAERSGTDVTVRMRKQALPIGLIVTGVIVAALVAGMPQDSLDLMMWRLWLPHIMSAATPPIGVTGRTLLAIAAMLPFVGAGVALWWWRGRPAQPGPVRAKRPVAQMPPTIRRADAHPDAAPRRPIRAAEDLGPPLPMVAAPLARGVPEPERPVPADLDQPLAAFDPISVPDVPREPVRAVAPLAKAESVVDYAWSPDAKVAADEPVLPFLAMAPEPVVEPAPAAEANSVGDAVRTDAVHPRLDSTVRRASRVEPVTEAAPAMAADASIAGLLDRLERGARKKFEPAPARASAPEAQKAESLDDTLVMLRRLAAG